MRLSRTYHLLMFVVLLTYGCVDTKEPETGDAVSSDETSTETADTGSDGDTGGDADGDGDADSDSGAVVFPIVYEFEDGFEGFASDFDEWFHNPNNGTIELDYSFDGPDGMVWLEKDLSSQSWMGSDWTGATVVEYRVKTIESNGGFLLPYIQSDGASWFWFSMGFDYPATGEWETLTLDLRQAFPDMAVDVSKVLRLGLQVFGPNVEGDPDAGPVETSFTGPERVRIALDAITIRGPEYVDDDTDLPDGGLDSEFETDSATEPSGDTGSPADSDTAPVVIDTATGTDEIEDAGIDSGN